MYKQWAKISDSICLFSSIAKEVALNQQWLKPCVPLSETVMMLTKITKYQGIQPPSYLLW